jgi:hypothetical protein
MGKSESKREHIQRSRDAQEAKNVSRCTEEDRCRAASPMGEGKGCERMIQEKKNIMPRPNRSGLFLSAYMGISAHFFGYFDTYRE